MSELDFRIIDWLGAAIDDPRERETLASLQITVGPDRLPVTEVYDTIAHTLRSHICVPAYSVARWLILNWWRLRWEPHRENPPYDWLRAHSMAAIGGGYAWPALTFSSDGEFVQLWLQSETSPDVSAIRYLHDVNIDIPAGQFEQAIEQFLDEVEARLALRVSGERELADLRDEIRTERTEALQATACKLQALAGIDPGSAPVEWMEAAKALLDLAGETAGEEIIAVVPALEGGLAAADALISAMRASKTTVTLDWAAVPTGRSPAGELPWERGSRLAGELRAQLGIPSGPLTNSALEQLLGTRFPLPRSDWTGSRQLRGGYRNGIPHGRTALLVMSQRDDSQRFYLARLIGAALQAAPDQHVLPVSDTATAFQKYERSFAQELLCPWSDLDAFTDQSGTDDEGIAEAAAHFLVSERLVVSTLVNKKKISRSRLQP